MIGKAPNFGMSSNVLDDMSLSKSNFICNDMITPKIYDPLPGEAPYIGDPLPGTSNPWRPIETPKQYGWICPKCGRVLAPHLDTCKFCESNNTTRLTSNTTNFDHLQQELNKLDTINYSNKLNSNDLGISSLQHTIYINEEMKNKFLNESESIYEAVDKYKNWEKENIKK